MSDFYFAQGDTASPLADILRDDKGKPVDIAGATIKVSATPIRGGTALLDDVVAENKQVGDGSNGSKGAVEYDFASGETDLPGDYLVRWTALFGGKPSSFPNGGWVLLTITPKATEEPGRYVTREELKRTLKLEGLTFADLDIDIAVGAAADGMERVWNEGKPWTLGPADEARYFTLRQGITTVEIRQATEVDEVALDASGGGDYTPLILDTDYRLEPEGAGPWSTIRFLRGGALWGLEYDPATVRYPFGLDALRVTGRYGWETTPFGVKSACTIVATRLLRRAREGPFGIVGLGIDGAAIMAGQIARDPEIAFAMKAPAARRPLFV